MMGWIITKHGTPALRRIAYEPAFVLVTILVGCLSTFEAAAMTIDVTEWNGRKVLSANGEIVAGDAQRFTRALSEMPATSNETPIVLLRSPGGNVGEALRISELFSRSPVHTVVPNGARCASACASILFIAGKYRTVEDKGLLGQHSCSINGRANQACNNLISEHALQHGVSYGSIAAFVTYAAPRDMLWFSRARADCYGLTRYLFTSESGFEKSEPCVMEVITGSKPDSQSAWRVDFNQDGYRAFLRPVSDDVREMELNIFCEEKHPGSLFASMDVGGPADVIRRNIKSVAFETDQFKYVNAKYDVAQVDEIYSRVTIEIKKSEVLKLLKATNAIRYTIDLHQPYVPMVANSYLSNSRKALLFVANHCSKR